LPFRDELTLQCLIRHARKIKERVRELGKYRRRRRRPGELHDLLKKPVSATRGKEAIKRKYLAPDMRGVLVDERLRGIAEQELRDDLETNFFLAVERLLKDVASVAVHRELDDASAGYYIMLERRSSRE
jgi:hypothetical protein